MEGKSHTTTEEDSEETNKTKGKHSESKTTEIHGKGSGNESTIEKQQGEENEEHDSLCDTGGDDTEQSEINMEAMKKSDLTSEI